MVKEVTFDYSKTAGVITAEEMANFKTTVMSAKETLLSKTGAGSDFLGWIDLPVDYDKDEFARIKKAAAKIQSDSDVLLVVGIGGSYLGARAAIEFLSHSFYMRKKEEFYRFYRDKMLCLDAKPNAAHKKLAELEAAGKLKAVVTQNIDGLHQAAGSKKVLELHGSVHRNYCQSCGKLFDAEYILKSSGIPTCDECGGSIKPDVVLYEEGLDQQTLEDAVYYISHADMLIIGGTSLAVYPAAGLIDYYRGNKLVLINKSTTPLDNRADLLIQGSIGAVLSEV